VTPALEQSVTFNAKPMELYRMFMDSALHSAATGMPAKVSSKVGGQWSAFGKMLVGRNLALLPGRMIVQSWRSSQWKKDDPDSVLVVSFQKQGKRTTLHLTHVGVPKYDYKGVTKGWPKYYWQPWKAYLAKRKRK
jgi:activator of HSP90 ATPase